MSVANAHAFLLTIMCLIQFVCPCPPLSRLLTTFPQHFSAPHACSSSPLHDWANTSPLIDGGTFALKGHASFANPQVDENGFPACMLIDPDKISAMIAGKSNRKRFPHLFWGHRGYVRMKLVTVDPSATI